VSKQEDIKQEAAHQGRDPKTRRLLLVLSIVAVLGFLTALVAGYAAWKGAQQEAAQGQGLATQVDAACQDRDHIPPDLEHICASAKNISKDNPEPDDPEINDPDPNDPDPNDPEKQDPEIQDPENQNPEAQDGELQNDELQDPEPDDPEAQDPEIQDPEQQDPEIDDPDPNSALNFEVADNCTPANGEVVVDVGLQVSRSPGVVTYTITCQTATSGQPPA
jgi:type II secretory pathway pseudopilin PulG